MERSQEKITEDDLKRILMLAQADIQDFFERNPKYGRYYRGAEVLIALGQGAALHYIDEKNGVKDFDVWFFYSKKEILLPYRRRGKVDFGLSKFGKDPNDEGYAGRRIDILMRSDSFFSKERAQEDLINYLEKSETKTAKALSEKAMVGLWPDSLFGKVLWNAGREGGH